MARTWRNCDEYTALISATYSVAVNAETMWEAEDLAFDMVEEPLKANDIEPDTWQHPGLPEKWRTSSR